MKDPKSPIRSVATQLKTNIGAFCEKNHSALSAFCDLRVLAAIVICLGGLTLVAFAVASDKEPWRATAEKQMPKPIAAVTANYILPEISPEVSGCTDNAWTATSINNAPSGRSHHTAVWTGSEMIVWGGYTDGNALNTGGRYNPIADSWTATSTTNAPSARYYHTAVWTGSEMIVWGGSPDAVSFPNNGGRYNPVTDSWAATSTTNAPSARYRHTAVWTGNEMIIWGGYNGSYPNTGGRYNPVTDSWTATSTINAPSGRWDYPAVWTGSEMIVWGGGGFFGFANTGGRYNPVTDSWTATSTTNAPLNRSRSTAVWTGFEMIVWGGDPSGFLLYPGTGGRYYPVTDTWTATSTTNAPSGRWTHTAAWTGSEMIVWGGSSGIFLGTGGRYNPATNNWIASSANAPSAREFHTAVWTGSEMIVWGGFDGSNRLSTGGRYCAQSPAECEICHKGTTTLTLPCNSLEYRRHIDHGDRLGPCPSKSEKGR